MCLTIPGKVIKIEEKKITVDYGSEKRTVEINLIDNLKIGDHIVVSNKIAIAKIPEEKAKKFLEILK